MRVGRAIATVSIAAGMALFASHAHASDDDDRNKTRTRVVDCGEGERVQAAVNGAKRPTTIFIEGACTEDVLVDKDDIALSGNRAGAACDTGDPRLSAGGTIDGTVTVAGVRARIEFLTITGSGAGILVTDRGAAEIACNAIHANQAGGVLVLNDSFARLRDNLISSNGQRSFNQANVFFDCGLFVGDASAVKSFGNTYKQNQYCAVEADRQAYFRNGSFIPRGTGEAPDPGELDIYVQKGCNQGDPAGSCGDPGTVALEVFNGGNVDLRNADVTGLSEVSGASNLRIGTRATVNGNIDARHNSVVRIESRPGLIPPQTTEFHGGLFCSAGALTFFSRVQCGQTCTGPIPGSCVP